MVRTLDGALTTALNNVTRVPAFKLTIEDVVDSGFASERHRLCNGAMTGLHRSSGVFAQEQALLQ